LRIVDQEPEWVGPWVAARNGGTWSDIDSTAVGLEHQGHLVAGTIYTNFLGQSICMHTAIERLNREFLWYCFHYPFNELNVKKVLGLVDSFNAPAIRLNRHLGFEVEAVVRAAGRKGDLLIFSMTRGACRWLNAVKRPGVRHNGQIICAESA
jgi:hypothetical protein